MDFLTTAMLLLYNTAFLIAVIQFLRRLFSVWQQHSSKRERKPRGRISHSYRTDPKNRHLQSDLLDLLRGDVPTAKRLLQHQRRMHPGKSDNWYLEKVIWDLERDRRR